jgi:hypothetical protein
MKNKTAEAILNRPIKKSKIYKEVQEEFILNKCIGFCNPPRIFRAASKINKICPQCKASDRWREY